jgi:Domain of unknown function (DUF4404)
MTERPSNDLEALSGIREELHEVAQLLREAPHLRPDEQRTLADLLDELRGQLEPVGAHSVHTAHVAEIVTRLARALHEKQHAGRLAPIQDRLEAALVRAEAEAPIAVGVVRRFVDALASIGI